MKSWKFATILAFLLCTNAFATTATDKQLDTIQNSTGGSALSVPSVGTAVVSDTATQTLTNKSISGSSNTLSNIGTGSLASGFTLGVTQGGTGLATAAAGDLLLGSGSNTWSLLTPGTQYQSLVMGASTAGWGAVNLAQSAAVTGILAHTNGGSDSATLAGGAANFLGSLTNATTTGYFLEYNGTNYVFNSVPSVMPSVNGGSGSPAAVVAGTGVALSSIGYENAIWVAGSGGPVTVTATPSVTACTADFQKLTVIGTSNTNTVKLQDQASLSGSGLYLNGPVTLGAQQSISLHCDATLTAWVEDARSN